VACRPIGGSGFMQAISLLHVNIPWHTAIIDSKRKRDWQPQVFTGVRSVVQQALVFPIPFSFTIYAAMVELLQQ